MEDKSSIKTQLNFSVDSILKKTQHKRKSDETLHSLKSPKETKINTKGKQFWFDFLQAFNPKTFNFQNAQSYRP